MVYQEQAVVNRKRNGFTLIELIIVIAIVVVLSTGAIFSGTYLLSIQDLNITEHNVETTLETARDYTLDHYNGGSNYGVAFTSSSYILYKGTTYPGTTTKLVTTSVPVDVTINSINFNSTTYIYFQSVTGLPSNTGSVVVHTVRGNYTISINADGIISTVRS